jgi:hypothetical protein
MLDAQLFLLPQRLPFREQCPRHVNQPLLWIIKVCRFHVKFPLISYVFQQKRSVLTNFTETSQIYNSTIISDVEFAVIQADRETL